MKTSCDEKVIFGEPICWINGSGKTSKFVDLRINYKYWEPYCKPTQVGWYKCTKAYELSTVKELGKLTP